MLVRGDWLFSLLAIVFGIFLPFCTLVVGRDFVDFALHLHSCISKPSQNHDDRAGDVPLASTAERKKDDYSLLAVVLTTCVFISIFSATVVGAILHREDQRLRLQWMSGALAPAGATVRWLLSRLNGRRPGFPVGTFIANIGAALLDFSIGAVLLHSAMSSTVMLGLNALITGFAGSLSTVSTWVNESVSLERPQRYIYVITTVTTTVLTGVVIYGTAYWVPDKVAA